MTIYILKSDNPTPLPYIIDDNHTTLLNALTHIKATDDASLTFGGGCRASVCGSCAVRVNDKEVLSCGYRPKDGDIITPLNYHPILRDLKIDKTKAKMTLTQSSAWQHSTKDMILSHKDEKTTQIQTDCILCNSCYSSCPVYAINPKFIGPFALTRSYRYAIDPRETDSKSIIDNIQADGVWDCTLCGECTTVCPKGIDPKMDITNLRGLSIQAGYDDPSFSQMSFGTPNFGFDPNAGF